MQNVGYCSIVIRLKLGIKTISFELSIRLYIRHDSPFYTSAIPSKRLQFLLHVYSLFYTSTIPSSRLQSLLHVYNPFYTSTIPSTRLQSFLHVYNPFYRSTIPSTKLPSQKDPSSPRECLRELLKVGQLDEEHRSALVYYPVIIYIVQYWYIAL